MVDNGYCSCGCQLDYEGYCPYCDFEAQEFTAVKEGMEIPIVQFEGQIIDSRKVHLSKTEA